MWQDMLAEHVDRLHDATMRHARPVQAEAHLLDAEPLLVLGDLVDAVLRVADDEPVLPELFDREMERLVSSAYADRRACRRRVTLVFPRDCASHPSRTVLASVVWPMPRSAARERSACRSSS